MNIERLEILRDFLLREVPRKRFKMETWFTDENGFGCEVAIKEKTKINMLTMGGSKTFDEFKHNCGTAACALGWATMLFPEELILNGATKMDERLYMTGYADRVLDVVGDSSRYVFSYLFSGGWTDVDNSPQGAAYRIDRVIQNYQTEKKAYFEHPSDMEHDQIEEYFHARDEWLRTKGVDPMDVRS